MNILTDELPTSVDISDKEYQINADFRTCLKIIMAFEDNELTPQEKHQVLLSNFYPTVPANTQEAIAQAQWFLNGDKSENEDKNEESPVRVYSFSKDANFIFAAFRQTHGIDLQKEDLHWWTFLALFMDLGQDTTFCQLVGLRKRLKSGKATKEEQAAAAAMGDVIDVPEMDTRTLTEKEAEAAFMAAIKKQRQNKQ
jgi:hypothetical protein